MKSALKFIRIIELSFQAILKNEYSQEGPRDIGITLLSRVYSLEHNLKPITLCLLDAEIASGRLKGGITE